MEISLQEVLTGPHALEWRTAMAQYEDILARKRVWEHVDRVEGSCLPTRWVLERQYDEDGNHIGFKAEIAVVPRSVPSRHPKRKPQAVDAAAQYRDLRLFLAIAAAEDLSVTHFKMEGIHLDCALPSSLYVTHDGHTYRVDKYLRGMVGTSTSVWNKLRAALKTHGYRQLPNSDLYVSHDRWTHERSVAFALGEEILLLAPSGLIDKMSFFVHTALAPYITYQGPLVHAFGLKVVRDRLKRTIWISQAAAIRRLCAEFAVDGIVAETPVPTSTVAIDKADMPTEGEYEYLVTSLRTIANSTRPDTAYAVSRLGPCSSHNYALAQHILAYLPRTADYALAFGGRHDGAPRWSTRNPLAGYTDSAPMSESESRSWQTGHVFHFLGSTVSWSTGGRRYFSAVDAANTADQEGKAEKERLRKLLFLLGPYDDGELRNVAGSMSVKVLDFDDKSACEGQSERTPLLPGRSRAVDPSSGQSLEARDDRHPVYLVSPPDEDFSAWVQRLGVEPPTITTPREFPLALYARVGLKMAKQLWRGLAFTSGTGLRAGIRLLKCGSGGKGHEEYWNLPGHARFEVDHPDDDVN